LVYLEPFHCNSGLKCALHPKIAKNSLKPLSWGFKLIDVNKSKKPVTSACYDKQHVCNHLQPFSHYTSQQRQNNVFLGVPLFDALVRGEPPHLGARNFVTKTRHLEAANDEDFVILACTVLIQCQGVTDGQTMAKTRDAFCYGA